MPLQAPRKESLVGNFCRDYTTKTPKPTMGKACRVGYGKGYDKGVKVASTYDFSGTFEPIDLTAPEPPVETQTKRETPPEPAHVEKVPSPEPEQAPKLLVSLPAAAGAESFAPAPFLFRQNSGGSPAQSVLPAQVTVDDQEIYLQIFEGDDHMAKIKGFCDQYMADSADSCVKQLTPHVEKKL